MRNKKRSNLKGGKNDEWQTKMNEKEAEIGENICYKKINTKINEKKKNEWIW